MGSWSLTIHGHGIHDNGKDEDIDQIIKKFIADLHAAGHQLDASYLTVGSGRKYTDDLADSGGIGIGYF